MPSYLSEFTISSCSEGRTRDVHSFITFNWCICLFLTLSPTASMTQAEKFPDSLLKSDVNLFNHLVRKADVAGCCFAGSVLRWHEVAPYQCRWFVLSEVVLMLLMQITSIRYLRHNWLFDVVWWSPRTLWYVDDNHYHFTGPFREKRYQKHRRE